LRVAIHDADGYAIEEEEFPLPVPSTVTTIKDLMAKIGLNETPPLKIEDGASAVRSANFSATWTAKPSIQVNDRAGHDLVTLNGFAMHAEKSSWTSMEVEPVTYQPLAVQSNSVSIPFSVAGNSKDKKSKWQATGTIKVEFTESAMRVAYTLSSKSPASIPEAGIRLQLGTELTQLAWNRDALSSVPAKDQAEAALEQKIPPSMLQATGSKRRAYWVSADGDGTAILAIPTGEFTNLRPGETSGEIILSDFLASGNFLGKFDKDTAEKKLAADEKFSGGFTLYFLTREQTARFQSLSDAERDLTWLPRVRAEGGVQ
jgi:hypothetical protein